MSDWDEKEGIVVPSGSSWLVFREKILEQFGEEISWLKIEENDHAVVLKGSVVSETAKRGLVSLIKRACAPRRISDQALVVAPSYHASSRPRDHFGIDNPSPRRLTRYPSIASGEVPAVGVLYAFEVDLTVAHPEGLDSHWTDFEIDSEHWTELRIIAEVQSEELDIDPEECRKPIKLYRDGSSKSAKFVGTVLACAQSKGHVNLHITFQLGQGVRGFASKQVALQEQCPQRRK